MGKVSRFVTVRLEGARSSKDADLAFGVSASALVKTSWLGINWGRILDALGYSRQRWIQARSMSDIA